MIGWAAVEFMLSARAFKAPFMASKPQVVPRARLSPRNPDNSPLKRSLWLNRTPQSVRGSIAKRCSPSNKRGTNNRPIQRGSCGATTTSTVGAKCIALLPTGWMATASFARASGRALIDVMNEFHCG